MFLPSLKLVISQYLKMQGTFIQQPRNLLIVFPLDENQKLLSSLINITCFETK